MPVSALLVCRDEEAVRVLRRSLEELAIQADVCGETADALCAVAQQKYDAVMVDCDDLPSGAGMMRELRRGTSNRMAIVFAITHGTSIHAAFDMGANFVLEKPLTPERAARSLRAAHGLMMRERRRYLRQSVNLPAVVSANGTAIQAVIVDVSEGGVSVRGVNPSLQGSYVRLNFELPDSRRSFDIRAEVSWTGPDTRAGLRFLSIPENARRDLYRWLEDQPQIPDSQRLESSLEMS
jgi:DNA-binding response OmpR family regulator